MTGRVERVLVVGGGIAGTTAAIALRRVGIEVRIAERGAEWSGGGNGITVMAPALRVLRDLDLLEQCLRRGYGIIEMAVCDAGGEVLQRVALPRLLGPDLPAIGGMLRSDLHRVLADAALDAGAEVSVGTSLESFQQRGDSVAVRFDDGTSGSYDLVVGADGWLSGMRHLLFGAAVPEPRFLHQAVWRAVTVRPRAATATTFLYGAARKAGFTPITDELMYTYVVEPVADRAKPAPERRPEMMRELLSEFGGPIAEARDTISNPDLVDVRPLHALIVPPPWAVGRVILIGDAVHTTTPQMAMGGALSMEDGVVLAEMLAADDDVSNVLAAFTARRFDRCRLGVENSAQLSEWEKSAAAHGAESARLINESLEVFARPA
jgi:2-polyprenyl-6-methoxyphenol hydroxylase-like FAD-dependent oxidoreductase